jgi:Tol biopolymer transport system component
MLIALGAGCAEYNQHETRSEGESLSNVIQLTSGFDRTGATCFSRDMRWILFQAIPQGQREFQLYAAKVRYDERPIPVPPHQYVNSLRQSGPETSIGRDIIGIERPILITPAGSRNTCGGFSPDGLSMIFASTAGKEGSDKSAGANFPAGMEIFRVDGWEGAVALADPGKGFDLAQHPLTDNAAYDGDCAYSPDGKWICFTSDRGGDLDVYVMHADGSHIVRITKTPGYDGGASFSPDGKSLIYHSDRNGDHLLQIIVGDLAFDSHGEITGLKAEHPLTHEMNANWGASWHPDSQHIIYATNKQGHDNYELYLMRRDGSLKTRITFSPGADILPVFSPDGNYLMWTSKRTADHTTEIFLGKFGFPWGS